MDILTKIKKCLALANCETATEGEMQAALAKAKEIAMRHDIDLSDVEWADDSQPAGRDIGVQHVVPRAKTQRPYLRFIVAVLRNIFNVDGMVCGTPQRISHITLVGEPVDVEIAIQIFKWLERLFPRLLNQAIKARQLTRKSSDVNGYYSGLLYGLVARNQRVEESFGHSDQNKYALAKCSKEAAIADFLNSQYHAAETRVYKSEVSRVAFMRGAAKGQTINLNQVNQ